MIFSRSFRDTKAFFRDTKAFFRDTRVFRDTKVSKVMQR